MSKLIKPEGYKALLDMRQTEMGIKMIKEFFQQNLATELRLRRVTAPLFVMKGLGINDDLNGVERPVTFPIKDLGDAKAEVVHSLAKWKRLTLAEYEVEPGYGVYTDMNAIRADEELDNLHSLYVDQWDWEAVITRKTAPSHSLRTSFAASMPPSSAPSSSLASTILSSSHSCLRRFISSMRRICSICILTRLRRSVRMPSARNMAPYSLRASAES